MDRIVCIVGPTATGKTALSVALAKRFDGEIISCDSMLPRQIHKCFLYLMIVGTICGVSGYHYNIKILIK